MKKWYFTLFLVLIANPLLAKNSKEPSRKPASGISEICISEPAISMTENAGFVYSTGGTDNTENNSIIPLNKDVAEALSTATTQMRARKEICVQGTLLRTSPTEVHFMAYSVKSRTVKKFSGTPF